MPLSAGPSGGMLTKVLGALMQQQPSAGQIQIQKEQERQNQRNQQPRPGAPPPTGGFDQGAQTPLGQVPKRGTQASPMQNSGGALPGNMLQQLLMRLVQQPPTLEPPMPEQDPLAAMQMLGGRR